MSDFSDILSRGIDKSKLPGGGLFPEYNDDDGNSRVPGAKLPGQNPLAQSMYDRQLGAAKSYADAIPGISDRLYNNAATGARAGLANTLRSTRNSFNSRGLLNSGGERGAEAGARASTEAGLAGKRSEINQGLLQNLQGMEGNAFGSAAGLAQPGPNTAQIYQQGMQSDIARQMSDSAAQSQAFSSIGQGLGALGGAGLAGAMYGQQNPYSPLYKNLNGPSGYYGTGGAQV